MKKNIIVFFIVFILLIISMYNKKEEKRIIHNSGNENKEIKTVSLLHDGKIVDYELETYLIGVLACEMPASFNIEALKAMAVASRTFALYKMKKNNNYDLTSTISDQCFIGEEEMKEKWSKNYQKYYDKIRESISLTNNEYMTYNDEIIIAFYFSISNGYTENVENVFNEKLDYLVSVESIWDKEYSYKEKTVSYALNDFIKKLNIKDKVINNINVTRYDSGRVKNIKINNNSFKGTEIRKVLSLRSTDFEITINKDEVLIYTKGYGHGVGMSQYGANKMAELGYSYDEILKYYYTGVEIVNN